MQIIDNLLALFWEYWNAFVEGIPNLITGALVLLIFWVIGFIGSKIIRARFNRIEGKRVIAGFSGTLVAWGFRIVGFLLFLKLIGFENLANSLIAGAGIGTLVFGFAFKDIAENFLAGIIIALNQPFSSGEIIEVQGIKGAVKSINLRTTYIRTADGRDVYLPNSIILKAPLSNYTQDGFLRFDFVVGLDTGADVIEARDLILAILKQEPAVLSEPGPNVIVEEIGESTLNTRVLFWIDVLKSQKTPVSTFGDSIRGKIIRQTRDTLLEHGFSLPSPIREHKMYKEDSPIPIQLVESAAKTSSRT